MPETQLVGIREIRREVDAAVKLSAEHCDAQVKLIRAEVIDIKGHTEKKLIPIRDDIAALKRATAGSGDQELGLVRKVDALVAKDREVERRVEVIETTVEPMLRDLHQKFIIDTTSKTPRDGTPAVQEVERAQNERDSDSAFALRVFRRFWPLLLVGLGGPSAVTAAVQAWQSPLKESVQVQAEGVATVRAQVNQELELAKAEMRKAQRIRREQEQREWIIRQREAAVGITASSAIPSAEQSFEEPTPE